MTLLELDERGRPCPLPVIALGRALRSQAPGSQVILHADVPPGDGGLALGQAVIANAVVLAGSQAVSEGLCA